MELGSIIWHKVSPNWLRETLYEYKLNDKKLETVYLSPESIRYTDDYFVGYLYNSNNKPDINLVGYVQYKIVGKILLLKYSETIKEFRNMGVYSLMIKEFFNHTELPDNVSIVITSVSADGKRSNVLEKAKLAYENKYASAPNITEKSIRSL